MAERNFYEVLGISEQASLEEVKFHYHKLARLYHPDITKLKNTHDKFIEINFAYKTLKDPILRKAYDFGLKKKRENLGIKAPDSSFKTSENIENVKTEKEPNNDVKKNISTKMKVDFDMLQQRITQNYESGNFREALMNIEQALEINDQSFDIWKKKGNIHMNQNEYELAMESFSKACKIQDTPEIRAMLSEAISKRTSNISKNSGKKKGFFGMF